jgi:hypothetical protein
LYNNDPLVLSPAASTRIFEHLFKQAEQFARALKKLVTRRGQLDTARRPLEKHSADFLFQRPKLLAQGGLLYAEALGRPRDRPLLG